MHYFFYFLISCFESFEFLPCQGTEITMCCVYSHVCGVVVMISFGDLKIQGLIHFMFILKDSIPLCSSFSFLYVRLNGFEHY